MEGKNIWIINHYAIPPSMGGLSRHYYFAKELIKRGYKVRIFSASAIHNTDINMIEDSEKNIFKEVDIDGVTYTFVKCSSYKGNGLSRIKNMLDFMFNVPKIKKAYKYETPDLIYASSPDLLATFNVVRLAKKMKKPCLVEVRDLWPMSVVEYKGMSEHNPIIVALYQMEKWIYKKADAINFTMPGGKQYIVDKKWDKKINLNKVFNVNNGIDLEELNNLSKIDSQRDSDLDNDMFKVVYAGSIRAANYVDRIIDAAKVISDKNIEDIEFLIYGDGNQVAELKQKCENEEISNVIFKGRIPKDELHPILKKCHVGLLTYKNARTWEYGGSQNKVFEYLSGGLPIVTNINMKYSILRENNCGIDAEDNPQSIADAILKIKNLPQDEYQAMCDRAKETAKDYDFKNLTDKLEEVFEYAMSNK